MKIEVIMTVMRHENSVCRIARQDTVSQAVMPAWLQHWGIVCAEVVRL